MSSLQNDLQGLEARLRAPGGNTNWDLRRIYADCLEDNGQVTLANGQRWQAVNQRCPDGPYFDEGYYRWWLRETSFNETGPEDLQRRIGTQVKNHLQERLPSLFGAYFDTVEVAETVLAEVLWEMGIRVRGDEVK